MPIQKNHHEFKYYANQALKLHGTPLEKFTALYEEARKGREELLIVAAELANRFNGTKKVPSLKRNDVAWLKTIRGRPANSQPSDSDIAKLNDLARGSVYFARFEDLNRAKAFINQNYDDGIIFDRFEDGEEESGYRDVKYLLKLRIDPNDASKYHVCELQLHTTFTREAYSKFHPIYEITRRAGKGGALSTVTLPAKDVAELAPKLVSTYRTVKIRHMGGAEVANAFYKVIVKFHTDKKLSAVKKGDVTLDANDLKALKEIGPVINNAYFEQMHHAMVMIDGKLQPALSFEAKKSLAPIGTGKVKEEQHKAYMKGKDYVVNNI